MKYADWLSIWLQHFIKPHVKARTLLRYEQLIRSHIAPKVGETELSDMTPLCLQAFVTELLERGNERTGDGLSVNTVNAVISVLQSSLRTAHLHGYTEEYTADRIKRPRRRERRIECFTLAEQKKLEEAALGNKETKFFGIVLCLYTGLRIGELLALTWRDIDLRRGQLTVSRSCHDTPEGVVLDEPKTETSRRVIPLPKPLLALLKDRKKNSTSDFVVSIAGRAVAVRSYQRSFELLLKRLNIPHRGFHSLRHTFATRALECGMDIRTLSELLGHKNPTVTLNRYAHSLPEHKIAMMDRLGKLL